MKKHNSSQNVAHSKYKNVFGEEPIDLWSFNEPSMIKKSHNDKDNHFDATAWFKRIDDNN